MRTAHLSMNKKLSGNIEDQVIVGSCIVPPGKMNEVEQSDLDAFRNEEMEMDRDSDSDGGVKESGALACRGLVGTVGTKNK
ncbi:hypothetical protein HYFRA_00009405 [Hymenoscyphus fraxineus]|uniref:Uncharacterized protein n=1 Tax=Hymenoscyphus fraxineus TaxID=746836 RepID=A0A9N9L154_9HELO|nr:hypothetical protein HYFRA_00009405 [Hymenoscyphus fraxineus]